VLQTALDVLGLHDGQAPVLAKLSSEVGEAHEPVRKVVQRIDTRALQRVGISQPRHNRLFTVCHVSPPIGLHVLSHTCWPYPHFGLELVGLELAVAGGLSVALGSSGEIDTASESVLSGLNMSR
jgi:hypothetical protein